MNFYPSISAKQCKHVFVCVTRKYTVTVPDEQREWLDDQPHLSPSGLLQKAIKDQREKESE